MSKVWGPLGFPLGHEAPEVSLPGVMSTQVDVPGNWNPLNMVQSAT
jgi:hypothetical protein